MYNETGLADQEVEEKPPAVEEELHVARPAFHRVVQDAQEVVHLELLDLVQLLGHVVRLEVIAGQREAQVEEGPGG